MTNKGGNVETDLYEIEIKLHQSGFNFVCGIDEAGRGPLAGPVVAGAVVIPDGLVIPGINDSKKLSAKKREELYGIITREAFWSVGEASPAEIDEINILNASMLAMSRAFNNLKIKADYALVDGNKAPDLPILTQTVVGGDAKAACIAAASIVAKVTRDRMLCELDRQFPQYGLAKHKGYPTKAHYEALALYGLQPFYRQSFFKRHKI